MGRKKKSEMAGVDNMEEITLDNSSNDLEKTEEITLDDILEVKLLSNFDMLVSISGSPMATRRTFRKGEMIRNKKLIKSLIIENAPLDIFTK